MARTTAVGKDVKETDQEETTDLEAGSSTKVYLKSGAGVLYTLLSTACVAFAAQFMTLSSQSGIPGLQLIFLIKLTQLLVVLFLLPFFKPKLTPEGGQQTLFLVLTTIMDNLGTIFGFMSFVYVLPGISFGIIRGSMPFIAACIGFFCLAETVDVVNCLGIVLSAVGVTVVAVGMVLENTSSTQHLTAAILLPLATSFTKGPDHVIVRSLIGMQGFSILTQTLYANICGAVVLLVLTYVISTPRWAMPGQTVGYVIGLCLCVTAASFTTKLALKTEKAGITATIKTFTIPLSVLLDYIIHSEFPSALKFGGVALIVLGTGLVAVYTWWRHRQNMLHKKLLGSLNFGD
ncbi:PREDICTED: LOW QUALITY PROTEIN: solute carrier family 35 member G2-like [Branchiostoma belcheri]|uniref:LOW QUALITY PROTEIN: solute carrier family 35 member G2-like n=1 Tax=Branchiostoma belcheri TaxID=7741 RepID=A0A6P4Y2P9_BRABE|nr:PREDICTED: LOW QUALITY PROTEIN: solute carrier family 35 member G2-like [Branchiostoma belcheri]